MRAFAGHLPRVGIFPPPCLEGASWDAAFRQALGCALITGSFDSVMQLAAQEDAPATPPAQWTPLMLAAAADHAPLIELLARRCDVGRQDADGMAALHIAASLGNARSVAALLACGADPSTPARHPGGELTPLMAAALHCRPEAYLALVESAGYGLQLPWRLPKPPIIARTPRMDLGQLPRAPNFNG